MSVAMNMSLHTVKTIRFYDAAAAYHPNVTDALDQAEAIFIAGDIFVVPAITTLHMVAM